MPYQIDPARLVTPETRAAAAAQAEAERTIREAREAAVEAMLGGAPVPADLRARHAAAKALLRRL